MSECNPLHPTCGCDDVIRNSPVFRGIDFTVSVLAVIAVGPWTQVHQCPHGVIFTLEPTGDQIAKWAEDDVR